MRTAIIVALAGLSSAPALGAFQVRSVDCTNPNSPMLVSPNLFQSTAPGAGNVGPSETTIEASSANQWAEFDSYVAIDTGPSNAGDPLVKADGFQANPGDLSLIGNPFATAGQIGGLWFMDPASARPEVTAASNALFGGRNAVFLGRFTFRTTDGSTPSGTLNLGVNGTSVDVVEPGPYINPIVIPDSLLINFTAFDTPVNSGINGANLQTVFFGGPGLILTQHVFQAGPRPGGTARWEVHDLYIVEAVPAPGGTVLASAAVLGLFRRRRR